MSEMQSRATCTSVAAALDAWIDGEMSPEEEVVVERHLAACPICRAEAAVLLWVTQAVQQAPRPEPGEHVRRRLLAQVQPAATLHRVELFITERAGERLVQRREIGVLSGEVSPAPRETSAKPLGHTVVRSYRQTEGNRTTVYQVAVTS